MSRRVIPSRTSWTSKTISGSFQDFQDPVKKNDIKPANQRCDSTVRSKTGPLPNNLWEHPHIFPIDMVRTVCQRGPRNNSKMTKNDPEVFPRWPQSNPKVPPRWPQDDRKMIPRWPQGDSKTTPRWNQNRDFLTTWWARMMTAAHDLSWFCWCLIIACAGEILPFS